MKKLVLITIFYSLLSNVYSQKQSLFDTSFINTSSREFFKNNPVIDSIVIVNAGYSVYVKTKWKNTTAYTEPLRSYDYYSSNFLGGIYLFENKYGNLSLPEKELSLITTKGCSNLCSLKMVVRADSITCRYYCNCPSNVPALSNKPSDDYDLVFTKTEHLARIKDGTGRLQKQFQQAFNKIKKDIIVAPADSLLIYKVLVDNKDSCLQSIELINGQYSPFENMAMEVLIQACMWLPTETGGRRVTFISSVFVRLNKDDSITVDIVK